MDNLDETIAMLQQRIAALEQASAIRHAPQVAISPAVPDDAMSRRHLLSSAAGLLGLFSAGALFGGTTAQSVAAETTSDAPAGHVQVALSDGATTAQVFAPRLLGLRVSVPTQRGGGQHWARYTWALDEHFAGSISPVVIASAVDDHHATGMAATPTCAVQVISHESGGAGAPAGTAGTITHQAIIMVNNLGPWATQVTINALAIGEATTP